MKNDQELEILADEIANRVVRHDHETITLQDMSGQYVRVSDHIRNAKKLFIRGYRWAEDDYRKTVSEIGNPMPDIRPGYTVKYIFIEHPEHPGDPIVDTVVVVRVENGFVYRSDGDYFPITKVIEIQNNFFKTVWTKSGELIK